MRRLLLLAALCLIAVLVVAASGAPAQQGDSCTWGASSVIAEDVNGELVQSEPAVTGCVP
jgi:hypothetical protein